MQLSSIKQFLDVYRNRLTTEDEKRLSILRILKEEAGVIIDEKALVLKKGVLQLKVNTVIKNELFLYKEKIIQRLKEDPKIGIYDIC